jgi:uncharacterized membrane protein
VLMLILGIVIFFGVHSVAIVAPAARGRLVARLGTGPWKGLYAVLSIIGFVLLVKGFAAARPEAAVLYVPPRWLHDVALLVMLPVFPLLLAAYLPGRIRTWARHPLLAATTAWALAHLLANGSSADVLLFGAFLVWAVADRISLQHRAPQAVPTLPTTVANDAIVVVGGLALYAAFIFGVHAALFGVAPIA